MKATLVALLGSVMGVAMLLGIASAQLPDTIAAPGMTTVTTLHAEGAQVYECKADAAGKLAWQFREPVAAAAEGKDPGPPLRQANLELADGSVVIGKVVGRAAAPSAKDIPWLKLEVSERRGTGTLSGVTTVQRINTRGGAAEGACDRAGEYLSVTYAADYVFLRR